MPSARSTALQEDINLVASHVASYTRSVLDEEMSSPGLPNRQLLQLELAARGFTNQEIADQLNVSLITVKKQFSDIFIRLNVSNHSEAIGFALQRHLISAH